MYCTFPFYLLIIDSHASLCRRNTTRVKVQIFNLDLAKRVEDKVISLSPTIFFSLIVQIAAKDLT